ncbi:hypothetical protein C8D87_12114 [Lentzea atacamensis]|uniref:Uncharacterized protein n=1 Tax=Lentzea atacamensis TaxID=531938 RepID=A0ABX9DUD8_9PSEU|nr:hypothetical protein [Lentzea atacamensis]RAS57831.1 hypothetical protein C8D87_12114 [Lentzea atacamensis]
MSAAPDNAPPTRDQPMTIGEFAQQQIGDEKLADVRFLRPELTQTAPQATAEPEPETAELEVIKPAEVVARDDLGAGRRKPGPALVLAARELIVPHSGLYTDRPATPAEIVRRARLGSQVPAAGVLRAASTAYGYGAAGATVLLRTVEWVIRHPARLGLAVLLLALALAFPATRQVAVFLLTPFTWAHDALAAE